MLGTKLTSIFAVTLVVLFYTADNEVNAAPEPCRQMMSYYSPHKKPEKLIKPNEDNMEDKKKKFLKKFENMFKKLIRRAMLLEESEETTEKPRGVMEQLLTSYINFLTHLWKL